MHYELSKDSNLPAPIADLCLRIVDATELTRCNALYGSIAVDMIALFVEADSAWHEVVHMPHLELNGERPSPNLFLVGRGADNSGC